MESQKSSVYQQCMHPQSWSSTPNMCNHQRSLGHTSLGSHKAQLSHTHVLASEDSISYSSEPEVQISILLFKSIIPGAFVLTKFYVSFQEY